MSICLLCVMSKPMKLWIIIVEQCTDIQMTPLAVGRAARTACGRYRRRHSFFAALSRRDQPQSQPSKSLTSSFVHVPAMCDVSPSELAAPCPSLFAQFCHTQHTDNTNEAHYCNRVDIDPHSTAWCQTSGCSPQPCRHFAG